MTKKSSDGKNDKALTSIEDQAKEWSDVRQVVINQFKQQLQLLQQK